MSGDFFIDINSIYYIRLSKQIIMEPTQDQQPEETQDQIASYHDDIRSIEVSSLEHRVKKARNALFIAAGALALGFFISLAQAGEAFLGDLALIFVPLIVIFIALGFWTKQKPYTAIVLGLIVFIGFWIGFAILDSRNIYMGIIVKVFVIVYLAQALKDAKELQQIKEESKIK